MAARQVGDRILFIDQGVILEEGSPSQIFTAPSNPRTQRFLSQVLNPLDEALEESAKRRIQAEAK
jgi:ABC-type methionine transport system ATPase subunit